MKDDDWPRYGRYALLMLAALVVGIVFLATQRWMLYYVDAFLIGTMLVGEIGWGDPFEPFKKIRLK